MQKIDQDYFNGLVEFFTDFYENGKIYTVRELTDHPKKFITHVKHYIDNRHSIDGYVDVSFNNDYSKIRIAKRWKKFKRYTTK